MKTRIPLTELVDAYEWASTAGPYENAAYVTRASGRVWLVSDMDDAGEEPPEDIRDEFLYLRVPTRSELDLGRGLALRFAGQHLAAHCDEAKDFFRKSGADARFRHLVDGAGQLDAWHAYRAKGVEHALRTWAADNQLEITESKPPDASA